MHAESSAVKPSFHWSMCIAVVFLWQADAYRPLGQYLAIYLHFHLLFGTTDLPSESFTSHSASLAEQLAWPSDPLPFRFEVLSVCCRY